MTTPPRIVAVVGPTAAGKSELGLALARSLGGDVVNADSMQVYRGMDLGTAKLTVAERGGVAHHLLDRWDVGHPVTVAEFQREARAVIDRLAAAGRPAAVVGGSGLYVRAVLDDLDFPGTDEAVRRRLEDELATLGSAELHERLRARDPVAAGRILPSNGRRVVRALEVGEMTGRPYAAALPAPRYVRPAVQIGLDVPRGVLDRRIAERVDRMWAAGLVEEVRGLAEHGLREARTASRALGYAQVLRFLDGGLTEEEARAETVRATRRFARRQDSWFRRDARVHWLRWDDPDLVHRAAAVAAG